MNGIEVKYFYCKLLPHELFSCERQRTFLFICEFCISGDACIGGVCEHQKLANQEMPLVVEPYTNITYEQNPIHALLVIVKLIGPAIRPHMVLG